MVPDAGQVLFVEKLLPALELAELDVRIARDQVGEHVLQLAPAHAQPRRRLVHSEGRGEGHGRSSAI